MSGEVEQMVSEDLDHGAITTDIARAAKADPLPQDLRSKLGTSDLPSGWEWAEGQLRFQGRLYVPDQEILHLQVIRNYHDHPSAGHFGEARTSELICRNFHWPGLRQMVKDYVASCATCAHAKSPRHKPYGKLKQLPIPSRPWSSISMDFIKQLPDSEGFSAILVIIDCLTKQAIFIPSHDTVNAPQVAQLFLIHVFSKHGVPVHVTSDRGSEFVQHFYHSLGKLLWMRLHFTSGYHPEGDGQTEHTNQVLEQYLQTYTNYQQDDWATLLLMAEFAYNNATNATTGAPPFFANKGYHPEFTADPQADTLSAKVQTFMADLECTQAELKENIAQAQERYQKNADKHRAEAPELKVSDQAYVKVKFFRTRWPSKKLSEKNLGPFDIIGKPGTHSISLRLPCQFRSIHPVFHVSQLEPTQPNPFLLQQQLPPLPLQVDGEMEYEVSEILDSKLDRCCRPDNRLHYLVHWMGYEGMDTETSWISARDLTHAPELRKLFHQRYPDKLGL